MENTNEKTAGQKLQEELTWKFPSVALEAPERVKEAYDFCEPYKAFLSEAKTERECVAKAEAMLKEAGYTEFDPKASYQPGDKVYFNNRGKAIIASTFGTAPLDEGVRLNAAHIDAPRLDLKPTPVYEKNDIAYFKTHYYGGIRKYQWATIPLSLHGVIYKKNGDAVIVNIGEDPADPVFYISDLLPHLSARQNQRSLAEGTKGEELNILIGSIPYPEKGLKDPVKLKVLQILNEKYGIVEADFYRAELEIVAAGPARDVGFDRSLIASAAHDDRVCAYPALRAELDTLHPTYTTVTILTDKEEIGSVGATGAQSVFFENTIADLLALQNETSYIALKKTMENCRMLSSDVSAGFDPLFPEVNDSKNAAYLNRGIVFNKYTGARGKSGSNDAMPEYMAWIRKICDDNNLYFQTAELGKVDQGGGGTIAYICANYGMEVIDSGVAVLSMHAPWEIISKADLYEAVKAYHAFMLKA